MKVWSADAQAYLCDLIEQDVIASDTRLDIIVHHTEYLATKMGEAIVGKKYVETAARECFGRGMFDHRGEERA